MSWIAVLSDRVAQERLRDLLSQQRFRSPCFLMAMCAPEGMSPDVVITEDRRRQRSNIIASFVDGAVDHTDATS